MKALFFSFFACLMNWRALLVYGLITTAAIVALAYALLLGVMLFSGGAKGVPVLLVLLLAILMLPTLFASFYASYRDVFGTE
jgi:hypothetical protein